MTREILDQFQGKRNVTKYISNNGLVSYLTQSRSFADEASSLGASKLNTIDNENKHVLFLFNKNDEEVGRYYLGKRLQGKTPSEIAGIKKNLVFFDSWNPNTKEWVPCVGVIDNNPLREVAAKAVSFDLEEKVQQNTNITPRNYSKPEHEHDVTESLKREELISKKKCADEMSKQIGEKFFDFNKSFQKHAMTLMIIRPEREFWFYSPIDDSLQWIYKKDDSYVANNESIYGLAVYSWLLEMVSNKEDFCWLFDFLNKESVSIWVEGMRTPEVLINEIKQIIPSFKLGNDPQKVKTVIQWTWIDIQSLLMFIDFCINNMGNITIRNVNKLQDCSSYEDLADLILSDMHIDRTHAK